MQNRSTKSIFVCLALLSILGGCGKKDQKSERGLKVDKKSKKATKHKGGPVNPFDLDTDSMQTFALDDQLSKHQNDSKTKRSNQEQSPLFSWENLNAEESKQHQFKTLYFEFDKDALKPEQQAMLRHDIDEAKKMIKKGKLIVIEGHACHSAGSAIYNLAISERRARYVAQKFAEAGIDAANIKIAPRGIEMPVRKGGNREEQWVNRRVEIYAIDVQ
ncbi:OmpA family protein [Candidatus Babeliales bacterium]|nr:OmpA family protein [Candidatus Babeliales bacterium]